MQAIIVFCRAYPEIVIFLVLGFGYLLGRLKVLGFSLGSTASILILSLFVGQVHIQISPLLPTIAFAFFLFGIGYKVGPEFFSSLKGTAIQYILLSAFLCVVGLVTAIILGRLFHLNDGLTAGMFGGALTQSSVIGTATDAIKQLPILASQKSLFSSDIAVAYALTYIFGMAGLIIFYRVIGYVFKDSLRQDVESLQTSLGTQSKFQDKSLFAWSKQVELRAYQVTQSLLVNKRIEKIEAMIDKGSRIEQIKRQGKILENISPDLKIQEGDIIAIAGTGAGLVDLKKMLGPEVYDADVLNVTGEILQICVLRKIIGRKITYIQKKYGGGCFFRRLLRQGHEVPMYPDSKVNKCDIVEVVGSKQNVEKFARDIGYPERPVEMTDLVTVALGCLLGTIIGIGAIKIYSIPLTLGTGGGVLIAGLFFGWLRSIHPTFGNIPAGAQWLFTDLGLNFFITCIGLNAAPAALVALKTTGLDLVFAGALLTLIPTILALLFGKYVLKLKTILLLGGVTGAGTCTPALNALQESIGSTAPTLGYTVPYAFSNVLLTIFGTVIVNVMHVL